MSTHPHQQINQNAQNMQNAQNTQGKPTLSQVLTAAFQELDINEMMAAPQNRAANSPEALAAKVAEQQFEIQKLNEHIDWLLNNKKKLEGEITQLKSAPAVAEPRPSASISAAGAARELRQGSLNARNAMVLSEIISPPLAKRSRDFSKRVKPVPATPTPLQT